MIEPYLKSAKKVTVEVDVGKGGIWELVGVKSGKSISIEEAEEHALKLDPSIRTMVLQLVEELKKAVRRLLIVSGMVEKGRSLSLGGDPLYPNLTRTIPTTIPFRVEVIDVEPEGIVKVHLGTKIKIRVKSSYYQKEEVERKHGVKFTPQGFEMWRKQRGLI